MGYGVISIGILFSRGAGFCSVVFYSGAFLKCEECDSIKGFHVQKFCYYRKESGTATKEKLDIQHLHTLVLLQVSIFALMSRKVK